MHHSAQIMALKTLKDHAFWRVVASDHAAQVGISTNHRGIAFSEIQ